MRDINFNKTYFENYISKEKNDRIERILKLKKKELYLLNLLWQEIFYILLLLNIRRVIL